MDEGRRIDEAWMGEALAAAACVRTTTAPNPWVGAVVVPAGGAHAEAVALGLAGAQAR